MVQGVFFMVLYCGKTYKIGIIRGAHHLSIEAANALLKTLEEPPQATHLILLAESSRQILPTVMSRCRKLLFCPLSYEDTERILIEKKGVDEENARFAAKLSEGSPGKALTALSLFPRVERESFINRLIGLNKAEDVFRLAEEITKKDKLEKLTPLLEALKFFLRDILLIKTGIAAGRVLNKTHLGAIEDEAARTSVDIILERMEMVSKAEVALLMNANKRMAIENMLLGIFVRRGA